MGTLSLTKEAGIYSGAKTVSSISGAGEKVSYVQKNEIKTLPNAKHR